MPRIQFSDVGLRALSIPEKGQRDYWCDKLPSFGVRVSQGGTKTFVLKHRGARITIGRFPVLSLAKAREQANMMLAEFTLGKMRPNAISYDQAKKYFIEDKRERRRQKTVYEYQRILNRLKFTGKISNITHDDFARQIRKLKKPQEYGHALARGSRCRASHHRASLEPRDWHNLWCCSHL